MNISLAAELEKIVQERVMRGDYDSPEALIEEAVRRLIEENEDDADSLQTTLAAREAEIESGLALEMDEDSIKRLASEIHERGLRKLATLGRDHNH